MFGVCLCVSVCAWSVGCVRAWCARVHCVHMRVGCVVCAWCVCLCVCARGRGVLAGCEDGWVAGTGLCYKLLDQFVTFATAHDKCAQMGAHLVTVENQAESDYINNWLTTQTSEFVCFKS